MHRTTRVMAIAGLFLWLAAGTARADSDGYYCVGPGYLAYQFGGAGPSLKPHHLHVLRVGGAAGIGAPMLFDLAQFQVHGMECGARSIRIAAFDRVYEIALDTRDLTVVPLATPGRRPAGFAALQPNLGELSKPVSTRRTERVFLANASNGDGIFLEIAGRPTAERCLTEIVTRVVQRDAAGVEVTDRPIFKGRARRECGESP